MVLMMLAGPVDPLNAPDWLKWILQLGAIAVLVGFVLMNARGDIRWKREMVAALAAKDKELEAEKEKTRTAVADALAWHTTYDLTATHLGDALAAARFVTDAPNLLQTMADALKTVAERTTHG